MAGSDRRAFLAEIIQTHQRNLQILELQAVQHGAIAVPLALHNQIRSEKASLQHYQAELAALGSDGQARPADSAPSQPQPASVEQTTILFLAADPSDATRLRLGQEARDIQENLQLARYRDRFKFEQRTSVRPRDLSQALLDLSPTIVHFSGHGTQNGAICVEDVTGKMLPISATALAALFSLVADTVQCVVLNACYAEIQAKALAEHIPYVIGMSTAIGDRAAISFAVGFYKAVGAGRSIPESYKFGVVEIQLEGIAEHLTPVLITRT